MKIDTTATILQLSQLLAASAGVAGVPVVAGDVSTPQPAAATATPGAAQPGLSFLQLLTQAQQPVTADATPATAGSSDTGSTPPAPASDDISADPTSISNALLALLSQSNQQLPQSIPIPAPTDGSTSSKPGALTTSAVSTGCPAVALPASVATKEASNTLPDAIPSSNEKTQSIDVKNDKSPGTTDSAAGINLTGLEATPTSQDVLQVAVPASSNVQTPATDAKSLTTEISPVADTKIEAPKVNITQQPAAEDRSLAVASSQAAPATDVTQVTSRHSEIEPIEVKTPEVDRTRSATTSAATFNVVGDTVVEESGDIEPVESASETVEVDDSTHADAIDVNGSGESVHGATELPTAIDPSPQPTTVDAHSLAHHLQEMVTQLSKSDSPDHASVVLRLDPPELGRVNVHMTMSNDVVSIRMVASDEAARQVIERQINDLQQSLNNQGISFQDCQVQVGNSGQQSSNRGFRQPWVDNSGQTAYSGRRTSIASVSTRVPTANLTQLDYVA